VDEPAHLSATRATYDTVAVDYARLLPDLRAETHPDQAMLATFAELTTAAGLGPVADLGCGTGRITAHLDSLGVDAFGVDLSPAMVDLARRAHPNLRFDVGSITALDLSDATAGGVLAWYSTIHTPPQDLSGVFTEISRVLAPGGYLLVGFHLASSRSEPACCPPGRTGPDCRYRSPGQRCHGRHSACLAMAKVAAMAASVSATRRQLASKRPRAAAVRLWAASIMEPA